MKKASPVRLRAVRFHLRNVLQTHQAGQTRGPQEPRRAGAAGQWVWLQRTTVKGPADGNCLLCDGRPGGHPGRDAARRRHKTPPLGTLGAATLDGSELLLAAACERAIVSTSKFSKKKKKKDTRLLIPVPEVTKQTERRPYFTRSGFPSWLPGPWRPAGRRASRAHPTCAQGPREAEGERPGRKRGLPRAQGRLALPGPVPSSL